MNITHKKVSAVLCALLFSTQTLAQDAFKVCWSVYAGWMPWAYASDSGIIDKWADKYGIDIEVVQVNDYVESINQYTAGEFDACAMTNMDALTIPAVGGLDSTMFIVGDYSNGNDAVILKNQSELSAIKGQRVNFVEFSVSHYLLARALDSAGLSERDISSVNTADADITSVFTTDSVNAVVTWNPMTNHILSMDKAYNVFDSSMIPGEIIDGMVANTEVLHSNPEFAKALTGAWFETLQKMQGDSAKAKAVREHMAEAAQTDLANYDGQLDKTLMFYSPQDAAAFTTDKKLIDTMQHVAEFSFDHGLLGEGAPSADIVGIETPAGVYGNAGYIKLRFDDTYMQMAAKGEL